MFILKLIWLLLKHFKSVVQSADLLETLMIVIIFYGGYGMVKKLTAGVLQGASHTEVMQVDWLGDTFEIEIRPLTNKQASEVEALMQEGVNVKGKPGIGGKMERVMDFDTKKNTFGRNKSDLKAVVLGTTDDSLTEKVVEQEFPPKLVKEIGKRIKQMTGIGNQGEVENFNEGKENPSDEDRE